MGIDKTLKKDANRVLKETSRTFYIPISLLKKPLQMTVGSAYLCMRAIDEIEDHEELDTESKIYLLHSIRDMLNDTFERESYQELIEPYKSKLPEVTIRLHDWLLVCPDEILGKVKESTSIMAGGMASWVEKNWVIKTKEDLDEYTYYVAGLVGVMLSDIWEWYDGTKTDRDLAIGYGRGLQAVNMLRNQDEDAERGVEFLPDGWSRADLFSYAEENLKKADTYIESIQTKTILRFCKIPLALAKRTLGTLKLGKEKMTRNEVESTVEEIIND
ncbi:squalene/phytoene synthase family protein [Oceanobacillus senegalensis]|uniref:squalene/phytoene synthase family protein n=1 Tax=Oceanobacillus senegalensis TaxID=1936063 RepID=UPI000A304F94|nr:phytoene/squalene synthase family protein [Oceanobacillus senegalensis]